MKVITDITDLSSYTFMLFAHEDPNFEQPRDLEPNKYYLVLKGDNTQSVEQIEQVIQQITTANINVVKLLALEFKYSRKVILPTKYTLEVAESKCYNWISHSVENDLVNYYLEIQMVA